MSDAGERDVADRLEQIRERTDHPAPDEDEGEVKAAFREAKRGLNEMNDLVKGLLRKPDDADESVHDLRMKAYDRVRRGLHRLRRLRREEGGDE